MHLNIIQQPRKKHHNIWVCLQIGYPQIQFTHYFPYQHGQIETPWSNTPVHNGWLYQLLYPHWYRRWLAVPPPKKNGLHSLGISPCYAMFANTGGFRPQVLQKLVLHCICLSCFFLTSSFCFPSRAVPLLRMIKVQLSIGYLYHGRY